MGWFFVWWTALTLLGWVTFPLTLPTFRYLPDKGYAFSRVLGLLIFGYFAWLFGHLSYQPVLLWGVLLFLMALSGWLLSRTYPALHQFIRSQWRYLLVVESLFFMVFVWAAAYKMRTPEILGTEKPMDLAMISALVVSPKLPPQDPWFSGASISYYYFGYFMVSVLAKMLHTPVTIAYNLGVVSVWALSAVGAFGLGYALTRRYRLAIYTFLSVTLLGNLDFWHRAFQSFKYGNLRIPYYGASESGTGGLGAFWNFLLHPLKSGWDYFQASRIIPLPPKDKLINEFPSFSFFLSDMHPHVMAIPFVLLAMGFALNVLKAPLSGWELFGRRRWWQVFQGFLLAMTFGALGFLNSWDYPTYLLLLAICLGFQVSWSGVQEAKAWWLQMVKVGLPVAAGSFLLYLPFYLKFQSQAEGLGLSRQRTGLYFFLILFGVFLLPLTIFLFEKLFFVLNPKNKNRRSDGEKWICVVCGMEGTGKKFCGYCGGEMAPAPDGEVAPLVFERLRGSSQALGRAFSLLFQGNKSLFAGIGFFLFLLVLDFQKLHLAVSFFCLFAFSGLCVVLNSKSERKEMVFGVCMAALAFVLIIFCEFFYIRDLFGHGDQIGPLHRMNTVFKFHYQAWVLFAFSTAVFGKWFFEQRWREKSMLQKRLWILFFLVIGVPSGLYPVLTWQARAAKSSWRTLDGFEAYQRIAPAEAQAIQWIWANVSMEDGRLPVILQAWGGSYSNGAALATYTGYPTVLGWDFHEAQWRGSWDKPAVRGGDPEDTVMRRRMDIDTLYRSADLEETERLLKRYGVRYVYVGSLERQKYAEAGQLEKFSQVGQIVYSAGGATLYRVNP